MRPKGILRFNLHDRIIHAAVVGQGIALGRVQIIGPMLADGRLIALPAPRPAPDPNKAYWLLQRDVRPVSSLIDWICNEARVTDSTPCECLRGCSPGPHTMKNAKLCRYLYVVHKIKHKAAKNKGFRTFLAIPVKHNLAHRKEIKHKVAKKTIVVHGPIFGPVAFLGTKSNSRSCCYADRGAPL